MLYCLRCCWCLLRFFEIFVTLICTIVALFLRREVLAFFALSILPLNLANYFKQLYQATGEFSLYGKIMNANTILIFFANMMWIYLIKTDNAQCFLLSNVIVYQSSTVLDEPEREAGTTSIPIPQREESENIPLPDLPGQLENVQQSGNEIAERGMPT